MNRHTPPPTREVALDVVREAHRQWVAHGWVAAADGMEAVVSLMRAHQLLLARTDMALRTYDLSLARFEILRLLAFTRTGSMAIGRLGRRLQVHSTSISSGVDLLESRGLVTRIRGSGDRREVLGQITAAGRDRVEAATAALNAAVFVHVGLSDDEREALWSTLRSFRANAGDFGTSGRLATPSS